MQNPKSSTLSPRVIGFDLDGTIIDHSANKIRLAREYGYDLIPAQTPSGIIGRFLPNNVKDELQARLYTDLETGLQSQLMPGALEALQQIKASRTPYYLLSRRQVEVVVPILEQLGLWPGVFHGDNTAFVETMDDKAPFARDWGITHYIDDHLSTIEGPLRFISAKYLFDPYNVLPESSEYTKVHSWRDIVKLVA